MPYSRSRTVTVSPGANPASVASARYRGSMMVLVTVKVSVISSMDSYATIRDMILVREAG